MDAVPLLAVDIGGPLIIKQPGPPTVEAYRDGTPTPGAFAALRELSSPAWFGERIQLISQCLYDIQEAKREWMLRERFHDETGIPPDRLNFCLEPKDKTTLCIKHGATHFVDDRPHILVHALYSVEHLYLFHPDPEEVARFPELADVPIAHDWLTLMALLKGTFSNGRPARA